MTKRTFTVDELEEMDLPYSSIEEWPGEEHRWWVQKFFVFEHEGKFWRAWYADPATELQEGQDIWDDKTEIDAIEVVQREVLVRRWVEAGQ